MKGWCECETMNFQKLPPRWRWTGTICEVCYLFDKTAPFFNTATEFRGQAANMDHATGCKLLKCKGYQSKKEAVVEETINSDNIRGKQKKEEEHNRTVKSSLKRRCPRLAFVLFWIIFPERKTKNGTKRQHARCCRSIRSWSCQLKNGKIDLVTGEYIEWEMMWLERNKHRNQH